MIIRSQNKRLIVNFANVSEVCIRDNSIGMGAIAGGVNFIGTYSTEEKAIKVLDMIQDFYCKCESAKVVTSGIWGQLSKYGTLEDVEKFRDEHRILFVFQMPQDSEV